ncbi:hypothetical protein NW762_006728 [Fusarium torreyae]|uniref:Uncharacterized protein n=1 Tax=Fusarium torreyae TaxID=1237075 RepID=A0A9W8S0K4_9HYPO|nr:hypothetical protein NW762_006728 [Fusarium torreyae]
MALSPLQWFFVGMVVEIFVALIIIVIPIFAWRMVRDGRLNFSLKNGKKSPTRQVSPQPPEPNEVPSGQVHRIDGPEELNPITNEHRYLEGRIHSVLGSKGIDETVGFEVLVESFVGNLIVGNGRPSQKPTVDKSVFDEEELVRLAGEPVDGGTWAELISNVDTRYCAVNCFLVQLLYKRMDPNCNAQECLLPPEITNCYQLINTLKGRGRGNIVSVWRETLFMLSMRIYGLTYGHVTGFSSEYDPRKPRTDAMASDVADVLKMKLLSVSEYSEEENMRWLAGIFADAANSALVLFGQPSEWEAHWISDKQDAPGRMIAPEVRFMWNGKVKWSRPASFYTCDPVVMCISEEQQAAWIAKNPVPEIPPGAFRRLSRSTR